MKPLTRDASRNALRTGLILFAFTVIATALLVFTFTRTYPTIERSQQAEKRALLSQVLPSSLYDNDLLATQRSIAPDELLGSKLPTALWTARRSGAITAVILEAIAPDGYSGNIHLIIGIDMDGTVTGVRVTEHLETPGLGDYIDRRKSPWIEQFVGKSLTAPGTRLWKVTKDGGQFDGRAGATITPRAVVKAVRNALDYFARHRAAFVAPPVAPKAAPAKEKTE